MHVDSTNSEEPKTAYQAYPVLTDQETYLTQAEYSARFRRGLTSLHRDRKKGVGAPFILSGSKILYPLSLALKYHATTGSLDKRTSVVLVDSTESKRANVARKAAAYSRGIEL